MAAGQDLRHDFAPAWLKLPSNENSKQAVAKLGDRSLDRSVGGRESRLNRFNGGSHGGGGSMEDWGYGQPRRQRFYSTDYSAEYIGGFSGDGQRSRSRHGQSNRYQVNGAYSDPYIGNPSRSPMANGSLSGVKKPLYPANGWGGSMSERVKGPVRRVESLKDTGSVMSALEDDFPSLHRDSISDYKKPAYSKILSVWDSPGRDSASVVRPSSCGNIETSHKALVLKTGATKRMTGSDLEKSSGNGSIKATVSPSIQKTTAAITRETATSQPAVDVLNACLVKQPKNLTDKKSSFLRALRRETQDLQQDSSSSGPPSPALVVENGDSKTSDETASTEGGDGASETGCDLVVQTSPIELSLSNFHEDEQRLLREMGWKEADDDEDGYEITEAEVKEFEDLCRQLKAKQLVSNAVTQKNGFTREKVAKARATPVIGGLSPFVVDVPVSYLDTGSDDPSDSSDDSDVDIR